MTFPIGTGNTNAGTAAGNAGAAGNDGNAAGQQAGGAGQGAGNAAGNAGGQAGNGAGAAGNAAGAGAAGPQNFDQWLQTLPQEQQQVAKPLMDAYVGQLRETNKTIRVERDDLQKQLRELQPLMQKGSEAEKKVNDLITQADEANRKADFYADATANECRNPRAAYAVAVSGEHFDRKGRVDWAGLKAAAPELFGKPAGPNNNAGSGAGAGNQGGVTINDFIRTKAGAGQR